MYNVRLFMLIFYRTCSKTDLHLLNFSCGKADGMYAEKEITHHYCTPPKNVILRFSFLK